MNKLKLIHFPKTRKESTFQGGEDTRGNYHDRQPVFILGVSDEDEDTWRVRLIDGKTTIVDGCDLKPHPEQRLDNAEFVALMLTWGQTALIHPFIMIAIEDYAKQVLAQSAEEFTNGFVNGEAWHATARDVLDWIAARREADKAPAG